MLEKISIIFSLFMSITSLVIAILSFRLKIPKIKIQIIDKRLDSFFGDALCEHAAYIHKNRISCVRLRIINNSPREISIMGIVLKCNKEIYNLIDCTNDYWETVEFIFVDKNGEELSSGGAIYYEDAGAALPLNFRAYEGKDFVALFHNFPISIKKQAKAKLIIQTTIGVKSKKVTLFEYNERHIDDDYRNVLQYLQSINVDKNNQTTI